MTTCSSRSRVAAAATASLGFLAGLLAPSLARAAVTEPPIPPSTTGISVPQPVPAGEISVATSRGFTAMDVTLQGLFASRGENIDYIKDAQTAPGTFSPQCGFTGQLVMNGGSCRVGLGWYNATPGSTTPPPENQIYMLVPPTFPKCPMPPMAIDPTMACCDDQDFCPLATYDTTQMPQHRWNMPPFSADNIRTDPRYKGGLIGFVLMGVGSSDGRCNMQNKYSQLELNQASPSGKPWVGSLIYQSTAQPSSYYMCFEDQSTSATSWQGQNNASDGDFNDFVFYVSGITCKGGGQPCDTMKQGVCANGVTQCSAGENITCRPIVSASPEVCDGLDNDCDGVVDQGAPCPDNKICDKGKCVGKCGTGEFQCPPGLTCDTDFYCKDPSCINVTCPAGQICVGGACQGGCDGVSCPKGQACVSGTCLDLCGGTTCSNGQVCQSGVCIAPCECGGCANGQTCSTTTHLCVDNGCDKMACSPPATVCVNGACQDGCKDVNCPGGQACMGGVCVQVAPTASGGFSGILRDGGTDSGGLILGGSGGRPGGLDGSTGLSSGSPGAGASPGKISACACDSSGSGFGPAWLATLLLAVAAMSLRRRRL
jgi:hypothetical protein